MKKLRVLLLANNWVGYQIAKFLIKKEDIIGLGIHNPEKQRYTKEIIKTIDLPKKYIFLASTLRSPETIKKIKALKPDIIIAAFWGYILKPELIDIPPFGCINFHPGLLPYNRGMNPNVWPFIENTPAGVTIHYIDPGIDTGRVISQREIPIESTDIAGDIEKKTWREIVAVFKKSWKDIKNNTVIPLQQDESKATFHWAKDVDKLDKIELDKEYKAKDLLNILRARSYKHRSFAYFEENGKKIFVKISLYSSK